MLFPQLILTMKGFCSCLFKLTHHHHALLGCIIEDSMTQFSFKTYLILNLGKFDYMSRSFWLNCLTSFVACGVAIGHRDSKLSLVHQISWLFFNFTREILWFAMEMLLNMDPQFKATSNFTLRFRILFFFLTWQVNWYLI